MPEQTLEMGRSTSPADLYLESLSPGSRRTYKGDLRSLTEAAGGAELHTLGVGDLSTLRTAVSGSNAPGTANRKLSALRGVIRAAWRAGAIDFDHQVRMLATLEHVPGGRVTRGRSLSWSELELLVAAGKNLEERALLATLAGCGLRRAEAAILTWDRYTRHDRDHFLRVLGKGNKERRLRVPKWAASALNTWQTHCLSRPEIFRWRSGQRVYGVVKRAADRAGLGEVAPHDLRRSFYALCKRAGLSDREIQIAMGHASITTTIRYDRRSQDEALAALSRLDEPR